MRCSIFEELWCAIVKAWRESIRREGVRVQNEVWVLMKERERKERELMRCGS